MKKRFIIILLLLYGCREGPNEQYKENLVVFSFLCPNIAEQVVYVDRTYTFDEVADTTGVSGATCKLQDSSGTTIFSERNNVGSYFSLSGWELNPLTTYNLEVSYKDYLVKAHTTVPDMFNIISPLDEDTINLSSPPAYFAWSKSEASAIYNVWLLAEGDANMPFLSLVTFDTILSVPPTFSDYFDSTGWYILKVVAKDTNYYERGRGQSLVDTLEGGLGFVGSLTFDSVRVYIKK